jgi:GDPmannose 4,6-dehydratase
MGKRALITGITGQDGSYLAEHLLGLGYEVHGVVRRVALEDPDQRLGRIRHLLGRVRLHPATLECYASLLQVAGAAAFDECYHLAAQSFVAESFADGFSTMAVNVQGTHHLLESLRRLQPGCRLYFAASSEMFGAAAEAPQRETTPFRPRSPYAVSKVAGLHLARLYREAYGLFCCGGILFNHTSPRRGREFVTRKVAAAAARVKFGLDREVRLGNLEARRDWGHAADYVRAMHLMLQQDQPEDYVVATGEAHSVRELCQLAFAAVGLDYRDHVRTDEGLLRPADVPLLLGDATQARQRLGWQPRTGFPDLVREMVRAELVSLTGLENRGVSGVAGAPDALGGPGRVAARRLDQESGQGSPGPLMGCGQPPNGQ